MDNAEIEETEVIAEPQYQTDLAKARKFIEGEKGRFDNDRKAIKEARSQANGDEWRTSFGGIDTTLMHKVRVDAINQIINKICSKFTSNPFRFLATALERQKELQLDYSSYDSAIATAFKDSVVCGQGFVYADYAAGKARRLDAGSVMMDSSVNSPYVIAIDKEPKRGEDNGADDNLGMGDNIIEYNPETERLVFRVYSKTEEGVIMARVAAGQIEHEELMPISEYPIIRIVAEESWNKDKKTFRGLYHKAQGISDVIDSAFSRVVSSILTQPRMKYWVPMELAGSEEFRKQMESFNESDTAYAFYISKDDMGNPIPPPVRDEGRLFIEELVAVTDKMISYINMLFGFENAENADAGNTTAQEILFRKENQNANYSQYLFNLSVAMQNVCKIYESLGFEKVSIVSGPYENIYRQTAQQQIIAINDYCTAQPQRAMLAPLITRYSNLDESAKGELSQIIQQQANLQQLMRQSQEMQGQMQQLQAQNQQLMQTVQALQNQQLNADKAIAADMQTEQMRLAEKGKERAFKASEAEKDRAVELYKIELDNPLTPPPAPIPIETAVIAATDLNPHT